MSQEEMKTLESQRQRCWAGIRFLHSTNTFREASNSILYIFFDVTSQNHIFPLLVHVAVESMGLTPSTIGLYISTSFCQNPAVRSAQFTSGSK